MKTFPLSGIVKKTVPGLLILATCGGCRFVDSYWRVHPETTVDGPSILPTNEWGGYHPTQWRKWPDQGPRAKSPEPVVIPLSTQKPLPPPLLYENETPKTGTNLTPDATGAVLPPSNLPSATTPTMEPLPVASPMNPPPMDPLPSDAELPTMPTENVPRDLEIPDLTTEPVDATGRTTLTPDAGSTSNTLEATQGRSVITSPVGEEKKGGPIGKVLPPSMLKDPNAPLPEEDAREAAKQEAIRLLKEEEEAKTLMERRREELLKDDPDASVTQEAPLPPTLPQTPSEQPAPVTPNPDALPIPTTPTSPTTPDTAASLPEFDFDTTTDVFVQLPNRAPVTKEREMMPNTQPIRNPANTKLPEELPIISVQFSQDVTSQRSQTRDIVYTKAVPASQPNAAREKASSIPTQVVVGSLRPYAGKVPEEWNNAAWSPYAKVAQRELTEECGN